MGDQQSSLQAYKWSSFFSLGRDAALASKGPLYSCYHPSVPEKSEMPPETITWKYKYLYCILWFICLWLPCVFSRSLQISTVRICLHFLMMWSFEFMQPVDPSLAWREGHSSAAPLAQEIPSQALRGRRDGVRSTGFEDRPVTSPNISYRTGEAGRWRLWRLT